MSIASAVTKEPVSLWYSLPKRKEASFIYVQTYTHVGLSGCFGSVEHRLKQVFKCQNQHCRSRRHSHRARRPADYSCRYSLWAMARRCCWSHRRHCRLHSEPHGRLCSHFTLSAYLTAFIPGAITWYVFKGQKRNWQLILAIFLGELVTNVGLVPYFLYILYGVKIQPLFIPRLCSVLIQAPFYAYCTKVILDFNLLRLTNVSGQQNADRHQKPGLAQAAAYPAFSNPADY